MAWGPGLEGAAAEARTREADGRAASSSTRATSDAKFPPTYKAIDLVPDVIHPDVLWACTTCRACEEQCPVLISYVDKIVDMRRNLVMVKGEFPHELQKPFQGMEVNGNPWNLSRMDRAAWSDGLDIPTFAEKPDARSSTGSAARRATTTAPRRSRAPRRSSCKAAGVDFAILGQEETCTGDPARRAGNELLFAMLAEGNAAVAQRLQGAGRHEDRSSRPARTASTR